MRPILLSFAVFFASAFASAAGAQCVGRDLFAVLPKAEQAAIRAEAARAPYAEGLLYRATRAGQEITLAGTYHLPDPRHDALVAALAPELERAQVLLVEAGPEEEARLKAATAQEPGLMFNLSGPTLPEILPEEDWQALSALLAERDIPAFLAAKMKPAFLAVTLAVPPCALAELQSGAGGLDKVLIGLAEARGLKVAALEPWDTVLRLFDTITPEENAEILRTIRLDALDADAMTVTMANLYFARTPRVIWEFGAVRARSAGLSAEEVAEQMALSEALLMTGRNRAWVPVLEAAAAEGPVLAAFGALHLSGKDGVLALLENDGWAIERLD